MASPDIVIVGGGAVGLAGAWRLAEAGLRVTVADDQPGRGASWTAGGMLAPITEVHYGEEPLLRLNLASAASYPAFVADLENSTGRRVGYVRSGTITVALNADDNAVLDDVFAFTQRLGLPVERLRSGACRTLEPLLSPDVRGGVLVEDDHSVDPRRLVETLLVAAAGAGVELRPCRASEVLVDSGRVRGVRLDGGAVLHAATVVIAAGAWSSMIAGIPESGRPVIRPVKGQTVTLRAGAPGRFLRRTVRGVVRGVPVYLVPRDDGRLLVGATSEEQGFDARVTAEAVYTLLRDAQLLVPGISELEVVELGAAFRPGSPDNAPVVGRGDVDGLIWATGHYRNGILLTPITAAALVTLVAGGDTPEAVAAFSPARFNGPGCAE